jgi:hypothetical protein
MIRTLLSAAALTAIAGPAFADGLAPGQSGTGTLAKTDPKLDGSYYVCVPLSAQTGQTVTVTMTSTDFDTLLYVGHGSDCATMSVDERNDDAPGLHHNSQVTVTIQSGRTYWLRPTSWTGSGTGTYRLSASVAGAPTTPTGPANGFEID